ncbi:MAG TPA: sigma-70 family RNA polymerase sigma factor [Solirubrobacteraceae bacterium]|nr:sigma-70 family RNA polymerase sigma factor [Solirubrobacteraceae bacterium]
MPPNPPTEDDATLLSASARGDRRAFGAFYRRHLAAVVGFLLHETGERELAADLAAEVFAAALLAAGRYRAERPSALPWLQGIARHKVHESRRRGRAERRARQRLGIPPEALEDDDLARVEELARESTGASGGEGVLELVGQLPPEQRLALRARVIEERDYRDIAAEAGVSEAAVRQRVSRALGWLRTRVEQEAR